MEKMKAYKLQENGVDTVEANILLGHQADERDYGVGAQILRSIGAVSYTHLDVYKRQIIHRYMIT